MEPCLAMVVPPVESVGRHFTIYLLPLHVASLLFSGRACVHLLMGGWDQGRSSRGPPPRLLQRAEEYAQKERWDGDRMFGGALEHHAREDPDWEVDETHHDEGDGDVDVPSAHQKHEFGNETVASHHSQEAEEEWSAEGEESYVGGGGLYMESGTSFLDTTVKEVENLLQEREELKNALRRRCVFVLHETWCCYRGQYW